MFDNLFNSSEPTTDDDRPPTGDSGLLFDLRNGSEYADVTEPDEVERLVNAGQLERIYLVSPVFGGADAPGNIVPAGQGAATAKQQIDNAVMEALERGQDLAYDVVPDYGESHSLVPERITFTVGETAHVIITW